MNPTLRKPHVRVPQQMYLDFLRENGSHSLADLASIFDVSEATARRKLDGLIHQGKVGFHVEVLPHHGLRVGLYSSRGGTSDG